MTPKFPGEEEASSKGESLPDVQINDEEEPAIVKRFSKKSKYNKRSTELIELTESEWEAKRIKTKEGFESQMRREKTNVKPGQLKHLLQKRMKKRYIRVAEKTEKPPPEPEMKEPEPNPEPKPEQEPKPEKYEEFSLKKRPKPLRNERKRMKELEA